MSTITCLLGAASVTSTTAAVYWHRENRIDELTRLPNRRQLVTAVRRHCLWHRPGIHMGLLLLDLDGFKAINDVHGHPFGNRVLQAFARQLRRHTHRHELAVRLHGDEFAVWLGLAGPNRVRDRARELDAAIATTPITVDKRHCLTVTASIGAASMPAGHAPVPALIHAHATVSALLGVADQHMYRTKRGRARPDLPTPSPTAPRPRDERTTPDLLCRTAERANGSPRPLIAHKGLGLRS